MWTYFRVAREDGVKITVPANVVAEWWRKRADTQEEILEAVIVEAMSEELAKLVGETLGQVRAATLVDATVMVSAARRGDVVLTANIGDFRRLRPRFPAVRVLRV
jgi:hypothetical protein